MVLPAFYRLAREGLLPRQWQLVGNGRGDITHQDFRDRVHDALAEFGSQPGQDWDSFAQRVFFAGGGFSSGRVDWHAEDHEQTMLALGLSSKREITRTRTRIRVRNAMAVQT